MQSCLNMKWPDYNTYSMKISREISQNTNTIAIYMLMESKASFLLMSNLYDIQPLLKECTQKV